MAATDLAQPDNEAVSYNGVSFPKVIGDGRRISARDRDVTELAGLGFEALYVHGEADTRVQIYNLNKFKIPNDLRGPLATREFNSVKNSILRTRSGGQDVRPEREFTIADARQVPRMVCAPYVIAQGHMTVSGSEVSGPSDFYVCLGVVNGKFFKTSTRMSHRPDSEAEQRRFIGAWINHIWKS